MADDSGTDPEGDFFDADEWYTSDSDGKSSQNHRTRATNAHIDNSFSNSLVNHISESDPYQGLAPPSISGPIPDLRKHHPILIFQDFPLPLSHSNITASISDESNLLTNDTPMRSNSEDDFNEELKYRVVDRDSGVIMDIRTLDKEMPDLKKKYSTLAHVLVPRAEDIDRNIDDDDVNNDETDTCTTSTSNTTTSVYQLFRDAAVRFGRSKTTSNNDSSTTHSTKSPDPNGVKLTLVHKDEYEFMGLKLAQTISIHTGPIWAAKFSYDGQFLATGGQDTRIVVWMVGADSDCGEGDEKHTDQYGNPLPSPPPPPPQSTDTGNTKTIPVPDAVKTSLSPQQQKGSSEALHPQSHTPAQCSNPSTSQPTDCKSSNFSLFKRSPYRVFAGHTGDVIDLSWSRSNFLLSASIDKTVRMWHVSRLDCLQVFRHADFVTSVDFHPSNERYFVSGCFDKKIRIWDIFPDGHVLSWAQTPELVTAVAFTPDGKMIAAGLYHGQVFFYEYETMRYYTQLECRNRHGAYRTGRKVTGIQFLTASHKRVLSQSSDSGIPLPVNTNSTKTVNSSSGAGLGEGANTSMLVGGGGINSNSAVQDTKVVRNSSNFTNNSTSLLPYSSTNILITTNDSRVRLFRLDDYSLLAKYKGLKNTSMQIKASFSEDGKYVISGSEDGCTFIWNASDFSQTNSAFSGNVTGAIVETHNNNNNNNNITIKALTSTPSSNTVVGGPSSSSTAATGLRTKKSSHIKSYEMFENPPHNGKLGVVTISMFAPVVSIAYAAEQSASVSTIGIEDLESKVIVNADYFGKINVFVRGDFPEKFSE